MAWLLVGGEEPLPANNRLSDNWSVDNSSNGNCLPLPNNTHTLWRGIDFILTKFKKGHNDRMSYKNGRLMLQDL